MTTSYLRGPATTSASRFCPNPIPGDQLITLAELSQLLRIPTGTLRYWRHVGTGPRGFRIGRHVRYYRADVDAWLLRQRNRDDETA